MCVASFGQFQLTDFGKTETADFAIHTAVYAIIQVGLMTDRVYVFVSTVRIRGCMVRSVNCTNKQDGQTNNIVTDDDCMTVCRLFLS